MRPHVFHNEAYSPLNVAGEKGMAKNQLPITRTKGYASLKEATNSNSLSSKKAPSPIFRFPQGMFASLRHELLKDISREHFGMLLAHKEIAPNGRQIFVVQDAIIAGDDDLIASNLCQVRPKKEFIGRILASARYDLMVNAIIDVHTHPFTSFAHFSGVDDADEKRFSLWLHEFDENMGYGSLLLSRDAWEARLWNKGSYAGAKVKTQTQLEIVPHAGPDPHEQCSTEMQARTALALGVDVIRRISSDQLIALAGVGGLGSILAEQLVRSGFTKIGLIDNDTLDLSNLNRFAGGFRDGIGKLKVDVVKEHLLRINPDVEVTALGCSVTDRQAESLMSEADWILVSTDSHSSRQCAQQTAIRYGVPLISAGVSITVAEENGVHQIVDRSGEVIVARHGDGFCLHCLGRINPYKVAAESNPDEAVRTGLVEKGYVRGMQEKEPAVMPLNAVIASIATQTLIDQYQHCSTHYPLIVYESHAGSCCYPDMSSFVQLPDTCPSCGRNIAHIHNKTL